MNLVVLHLKLALFDGGLSPLDLLMHLVCAADQLDVFLVVVLLLLQVVDLLDQLNILLHESFVDLFMGLVGFCESGTQVVNILLQILAQLLEFQGCVRVVLTLSLDLLSHVHLVEADDSLLELLVVSNGVECVMNLLLELLLFFFLSFEDLTEVAMLTNKTTHSHSKILNDQTEVHEDPLEMSLLLLHLISLLLQFFDGRAPWSDVSLQLLDLVVENEFKLLKFLSFFLQVVDPLVLVADGGLSLG